MGFTRKTSGRLFVAWLPKGKPVDIGKEQLGDLVIDENTSLPNAILVRAASPDATVQHVKSALEAHIGPDARVFNALEDEDGQVLIPTGNISVVLKERMPAQRLDNWADSRGMRVVTQSKWRPKAVVLATKNPDQAELKTAMEDLGNDPEVDLVEQEVFAKFQRETVPGPETD